MGNIEGSGGTRTGNGERGERARGTGNGERGTGNGERGMGNGERGTGNGGTSTRKRKMKSENKTENWRRSYW